MVEPGSQHIDGVYRNGREVDQIQDFNSSSDELMNFATDLQQANPEKMLYRKCFFA